MAQTTTALGPVDRVRSVSSDVAQGFMQLRRGIDEAGPLAPKHRELINIAAFTVARIEGGFRTHCGRAIEAGATPEEIRQAVLLTFASCGGVGPTADALRWADEVIASRK